MITDIEEYLAQKIITEATRITYASILRRFGTWLDQSDLVFEALKTSDVLRFVKEWGLGSSAGYQAICAVRDYAKWKYGSNHPATKARIKRLESAPQRTLNSQQIVRLMEIVAGETDRKIRDRAILCLLLDTGLRESEACRLRLEDTNLEERTLTVLCKGGKYGRGVFSQRTVEAIEKWLTVRAKFVKPGVKTLFISVGGIKQGTTLTASGLRMIFKHLAVQVGFRVSPHDMRRSFACLMTENGAPTELVRRAGRWSSITMVQLYTRNVSPEAIRKYLPLNDPSEAEKPKPPRSTQADKWYEEYQ